jgi:hypothetical protein
MTPTPLVWSDEPAKRSAKRAVQRGAISETVARWIER